MDPAAAAAAGSDQAREEKLKKAIEIINSRINGLGVTEPLIRPVGTTRIEIQLPGASTKENPEIQTAATKPARLDFRLVHPYAAPPMDVPAGYESMTLEGESRDGDAYAEQVYVKQIRR
ncbi:MAG: hypothetical protein WDM96_07710 [Lacunisphaera sp.]